MPRIKIKRIGLDDLEELVGISQRTFTETFAAHNTEENMRNYLARHLSDGALKAELENQSTEFYFLTVDDVLVGYMKLRYNSSVEGLDDSSNVEIERLYVLREFHGNGLGKKLMEKAMTLAQENGFEFIWLGVWEHNKNAIDFYKHLGFEPFGKQVFILGNDLQTDVKMSLKL